MEICKLFHKDAPRVVQYECNFQAGLCDLFTQATDDDFDWSFDNGKTPSSYTGPNYDHTTYQNGNRLQLSILRFIEFNILRHSCQDTEAHDQHRIWFPIRLSAILYNDAEVNLCYWRSVFKSRLCCSLHIRNRLLSYLNECYPVDIKADLNIIFHLCHKQFVIFLRLLPLYGSLSPSQWRWHGSPCEQKARHYAVYDELCGVHIHSLLLVPHVWAGHWNSECLLQ